ncbi:MAG: phosphoethanolamine transferase [Rhodocyclaceae bacterium]
MSHATSANTRTNAHARSALIPRVTVLPETLMLGAALYWTLCLNTGFWHAALAGRVPLQAATLWFALCAGVLITALHALLLGLCVPSRILKPAIATITIIGAVAAYHVSNYAIALSPGMMRNVFTTDPAEARELLTPRLFATVVLQAGVAALMLSRIHLQQAPSVRAVLRRTAFVGATTLIAVAAILAASQDIAALMRNNKHLRYQIMPAALVYSSARAASHQSQQASTIRAVVGEDARLGSTWATARKPLLMVVVVGETARAANWGLNGYARDTTPRLAASDAINFTAVDSCGTDTETSVPCMFSAIGRRNYDEATIRASDSLLHLVARSGIAVNWVDNQSGCKGVCTDLDSSSTDRTAGRAGCDGEYCLDEVLLEELAALADEGGNTNRLVVLHQIGNHGPAYHRRYPESFRRFTPTCDTADLRRCTRDEIVNSYDNALLYTDTVLARTLAWLADQQADFDTALVYVSDHGESLGEKGLYLHGMPYALAPAEQTRVPMLIWLSDGFAQRNRLDAACLHAQADQPASHDHLFHTLLGLMDIATSVYDRKLDVAQPCRS